MTKNKKCLFLLCSFVIFLFYVMSCYAKNDIRFNAYNPVRILYSSDNLVEKNKTILLIHGLAHTYHSMRKLGYYLSKHGFNIIYINYPSRKYSIEKLAELIHASIVKNKISLDENTNIVTHSLGGLLVMEYALQYPFNVGRVVMIAPPNNGSEIVDHLKNIKLFKMIMGPAAMELGTSLNGVPRQLGPVNFDLGVIAGNKSVNPLFSRWIKGKNDGCVSTKSTEIIGMRDFLIVPYSHTFIMRRKRVFKAILNFLLKDHFLTHVH